MKYSSVLAAWLKSEGYTTCFFVAGGGIMHLIDGFRTVFKCIPVVHEHTAGVCAEHFNECHVGYEKAFALVTTGPGLTNIITAVSGCYVEHRELLVIAGQVKSTDLLHYPQRQRGVQEIDGQSVVKNITVNSFRIDQPIEKKKFLSLTRSAAKPHPGPVVIEVCLDAQGSQVDVDFLNKSSSSAALYNPNTEVETNAILKKLKNAKRPLFLLGGLLTRKCVAEHYEALLRLNVPCATTTSAIDRVPNKSALYVGRTGTWGGQRAANLIIAQADLVISIGAQLDLQQTGFNYKKFCPMADLVQVFPSQVELEREGPEAEIKLNCDPDIFLRRLLLHAEWKDESKWIDYKDEIIELMPPLEIENLIDSEFINPFVFLQNLSLASKHDDVFAFCSSGGTFTGALQMSDIKPGQIATTSAAHASMGYGLATAVGAAFACPEKRIIATEGEGGFVQNLQELALLKKHRLNIKLFIFDNAGYASIRSTQKKFFDGKYIGCDPETGLAFPDWHQLFAAYDIPCTEFRLGDENINTIQGQLDKHNGPEAFLVKVDPNQTNWPVVPSVLKDNGELESAPLYSMLPNISEEFSLKYGKYLPGG